MPIRPSFTALRRLAGPPRLPTVFTRNARAAASLVTGPTDGAGVAPPQGGIIRGLAGAAGRPALTVTPPALVIPPPPQFADNQPPAPLVPTPAAICGQSACATSAAEVSGGAGDGSSNQTSTISRSAAAAGRAQASTSVTADASTADNIATAKATRRIETTG